MCKRIKRDQSGHLLVNILVALSVVALLTTISIPYIKQYQLNLKLSATARALTADLRYTQQLTITEQVAHLVELDDISDSYQILKIAAATTTIKTVTFDSNVSFQSITGFTNNQVRFNSYGGVSENGFIVLINISNRTKTITVKPSGYVQLQ